MKYFFFLFYSNLVFAHDYNEAIQRAGEAAYIQSGLQNTVQAIGRVGETKIKNMGLEKELFVGLFLYKTYRTRTITVPISNNKRLHFQLTNVSIEISL